MRDSSSRLGPQVMIEHVVAVPVSVRAIFEFYGVPVGFGELAAPSATHSILFDSPMVSLPFPSSQFSHLCFENSHLIQSALHSSLSSSVVHVL